VSRCLALVSPLVLAASMACSVDDLTEVELPVITPENAASVAGAKAASAAAIRDLWIFTGYNVYSWMGSGLLSDELINARTGFEATDKRDISGTASPATTSWSGFVAVMYSAPKAIRSLEAYMPAGPERSGLVGQAYTVKGLALTIGGEILCNGIPFSYLRDDGTKEYDEKSYSNAELWNMAVADFDAALAELPVNNTLQNAARIGKARALLNLNQPQAAAAVVRAGGAGAGSAAVPTSYQFAAEYSSATLTSGPYDWMPSSANVGTPNGSETPNTMDWRDPRIAPVFFRKGQDGVTDVYVPSRLAWSQAINSPYPIATGIEARLIEAEADLLAGNPAWLTTLNQLRAASTLSAQLPPLADPQNAAARVDLVFKERAMWMYLTSHRLGDLRRLVRQHGRTVEQVFPTGAYFKGGTYGTSVAIEPSTTEAQTHPHWTGCTNQLP
jgi:hypothetical protein